MKPLRPPARWTGETSLTGADMQTDWTNLERVARQRGITLSEAQSLAERMRWPMVFKTHETLVLAPVSAAGA